MAISTYRRASTSDHRAQMNAWRKFVARHEHHAKWLDAEYVGDFYPEDAYLERLWQRCLARALNCPPGTLAHPLVLTSGYVGYAGY